MGWRCGGCCAGSSSAFWFDVFTLTVDGPQVLVLDFTPIPNSLSVYLNGVEQRYATDWSISGGVNLAILAAMGALTGDVLDARFAYTP